MSQCNVHRVLECNWLYNECWVNFRIGLWDSAIVVLKSNLAFYFEMKDLSSLWYFLGIEVVSSPKGYLFLQSKYTIDILDHACLIDTKTVDTPLEVNVWYSSSNGNPLLDIVLFLAIWFISPLHVWTLLMLFTLLVNLLFLLL